MYNNISSKYCQYFGTDWSQLCPKGYAVQIVYKTLLVPAHNTWCIGYRISASVPTLPGVSDDVERKERCKLSEYRTKPKQHFTSKHPIYTRGENTHALVRTVIYPGTVVYMVKQYIEHIGYSSCVTVSESPHFLDVIFSRFRDTSR